MRKFLLLLLVCLTVLLCACQSNEEKSRTLFNQAQLAAQQQDGEQVVALLQRIVEDYPQTETATVALRELNNIGAMVQMREKERLEAPKWAASNAAKYAMVFLADEMRLPVSVQELLDVGFEPKPGIVYQIAFTPSYNILVAASLESGEALYLMNTERSSIEPASAEAVAEALSDYETVESAGAVTVLRPKT